MAGAQARILTEDDDAPGGDLNGTPLPQNTGRQSQQAKGPVEPEFDIVDVDDKFQPIVNNNRGGDTRLTEDDAGDKPQIVEAGRGAETPEQRQNREGKTRAQRRRDQREQAKKTFIENSQFRQENETLRQQIAALEVRQNGIEPRLTELDESRKQEQVAALDRELNDWAAKAAAAKRKMSEAITSADGAAHAEAFEEFTTAFSKGQQLSARKNLLETGNVIGDRDAPRQDRQPRQEQPRPLPQPAPVPREVLAQIDKFSAEHDLQSWYRPDDARNVDSQVLLQIDRALAAEGFDPKTDEFWEELADRAADYLPHRFGSADPDPAPTRQNGNQRQQSRQPAEQRRGPTVAGSGDAPAQQPGKNAVFLSQGRKDAMIEQGILARDGKTVLDAARFNKRAQYYREYDRQNGIGQQ